jgi:hypothetical protein
VLYGRRMLAFGWRPCSIFFFFFLHLHSEPDMSNVVRTHVWIHLGTLHPGTTGGCKSGSLGPPRATSGLTA